MAKPSRAKQIFHHLCICDIGTHYNLVLLDPKLTDLTRDVTSEGRYSDNVGISVTDESLQSPICIVFRFTAMDLRN